MKKISFLIASAFAVSVSLGLQSCSVSDNPILPATPEGPAAQVETEITALEWVDEGFVCDNHLGEDVDVTIYGTDAGPSKGKLSYIDITEYSSVKVYGRAGDVVRLFINRVEFSDNFQFYLTIGEDGVATLDLADVYAAQEGAEYVHLNGVKAPWGTKGLVDKITVVE